MHVCILDQAGHAVFDRNLPCRPDAFLHAIAPPPIAPGWSSVLSACSPGTGSPISVPRRTSPLSSGMPCT
jgi:hypothetical protein